MRLPDAKQGGFPDLRRFFAPESFALVGCAEGMGGCFDAPFVHAPTAM